MPHTDTDNSSYKAFISYSHAADRKLAPTLQSALQRFAKPWYKIRSFKVFRDDTNLSVTPALWPAIEAALAASEFFILLASPEAAASKWVRKEVAYWLANRSADKLLIVQTGGKIKWDDHQSDFDWLETNALPDNLAGRFGVEPFYLDLSWTNSPDNHLSLRHSEFRKAVLKLAATLFGRDMAELDSEEVRQHRKNMTAAWLAVIALTIVTSLAIVAAFLFLQQKRETELQRETAVARQVAAESTVQLSERVDLSLLLSIAGVEIQNNLETRSSLLRALQYSPFLSSFLYGHEGMVRSVAVHPQRAIFASSGDDGKIILWDLATRRPLGCLSVSRTDPVIDITFNSKGNVLAASHGEFDGSTIIMWDIETRNPIGEPLARSEEAIRSMTFSAEGELLAWVSNGRIFFSDVKTWQSGGDPLELKTPVTDVAFHPSKRVLAIGTYEGAVYFWDYSVRRFVGRPLTAVDDDIDEVTFSKSGHLLAAGYHDGSIAIWNIENNQLLHVSESNGLEISDLSFSPDGTSLASSFIDGNIKLISGNSGKYIDTILKGHRLAAFAVAFGHDGKSLVSSGAEADVILWNLTTRVPIGRRYGTFGEGSLEDVIENRFGRVIGAINHFGSFTLWDVESGRRLGELPSAQERNIPELELAPDGRRLAAAYENKMVLWDSVIGRSLTLVMGGHKTLVGELIFSGDGKVLAAADDSGKIYLWDTTTQHSLGAPLFHAKGWLRMAFSHDGKMLASGGADGSIRLWSIPDGRPLGQPITGHDGAIVSLAISPDATMMASGGTAAKGSKVYLWDVGTRQALGEALQGHRGPVSGLAFSPDGMTLASGAADQRIVLWDIATRRPVGLALTGHEGGVKRLLFDSKGKHLISSAWDNTVIIWDIDVSSWKERACRIANRNLTCVEWTQFLGNRPYRPTCKDLPFPPNCAAHK